MWVFIWSVLKVALKQILIALITEKFLKEVIIFALEKLAAKTDNKVDDELVAKVKAAVFPPKEE